MDLMWWPETHPRLADERVRLRAFRPDDVAWVFEACQDHQIQRWTRVPVPYTVGDAEDFVVRFAPSQWDDRIGFHCAIVDAQDGRPLGAGALVVVDPSCDLAEAGYWLAPDHRGRGAATAALRLLVDWGFAALGLRRVELHVDPQNRASIAVGERVGFLPEGVLRQRVRRLDEQRDVLMLARLADDGIPGAGSAGADPAGD